jgi:hypothetical protein
MKGLLYSASVVELWLVWFGAWVGLLVVKFFSPHFCETCDGGGAYKIPETADALPVKIRSPGQVQTTIFSPASVSDQTDFVL